MTMYTAKFFIMNDFMLQPQISNISYAVCITLYQQITSINSKTPKID